MSFDGTPKPEKKRRVPRALQRLLLGLGLALALLAAVLACLPFALSSGFARAKFVQFLSEATSRPASLDSLSFRWSDGLRLEGLRIGQGDIFDQAFLCSLASLHLDANLLSALHGRTELVAEIQGLSLRHRLAPEDPNAPKPLAKSLPVVLRDLFAGLKNGLKPVRLPMDAVLRVKLSDSTLRLEQPEPSGILELRGLTFSLDAPSLKTAPVTLEAGFAMFANNASLGPARLSASLDNLADASGRLTPAQARLTSALELPGLSLSSSGSLATSLKISLRADLHTASQPLKPLLTSPLPELSGALALGLTLAQPGADRLNAGLVLFADGLRAARGQLGPKSFGPLSLNLLQEAEFDLAAETVRLPGSLDLRGDTQARWQGLLDGVAQGRPRVALSLRSLRLGLDPLLAAAKDFLPPGLSLGPASLEAEGLDFSILLPESTGKPPQIEASLNAVSLQAKNIQRRDAAGSPKQGFLALSAAFVRVDKAALSLPGNGSGTAEAHLTAGLDALRLEGASPLTVKSLRLQRLDLRVAQLAWNPAALFGVTGQLLVEQKAEVQGIEVQSKAQGKTQIPSLTKELRLHADLPASKAATASLDSLELSVPLLRVLQPGKAAVEAPLTLRLSAPDIRLTGPAPLAPAVQGANLGLDIGGALHCSAKVSLSGAGGRDVQSDGTLTLDAQKLLVLAASLAPRQAKASGSLSVDWKLAASLPEPSPTPATKPEKLSQSLKRLNSLHQLEAVLTLANLSVDWPLPAEPAKPSGPGESGKPAEVLRLRGLSTPKPLRASTKDGLRESSLSGTLAFGPLDALPGLGRLERPLRGLVTVNAAQQGVRSAQIAQALHLDGQELDQSLTLTLDKLDTVLDHDDRLAAALEQLDASISFSLTAALQALPAQAARNAKTDAPGLSGKGRLKAGAELRLAGGRSLSVAARFLSPGLDLRLGPDAAMSGLVSALRFERRYTLTPSLRCQDEAQADATPLSEQVFNLFPAAAPAGRAEGSLARLLSPGAAASLGPGTLSLAQARFKAGGLPLELNDIELRLDTSSPVPGLRSFRMGLLGGNILGSANIRKAGGRYTLEADCAFTGIDPGRLLPAKASKDLGSQAETAGRLSLSAPLTPDPEDLLQRLVLRADITKIGPRTLERMLYALDPEEQNETIVQQRRLMGLGYPRNLRLAVAYGNLSLSGSVEVKGFQLDLPQLDRLAVANLPIRGKLAGPLSAMSRLSKILDAVSGTGFCRDVSTKPGAPNGTPGALRIVESLSSQGVTP